MVFVLTVDSTLAVPLSYHWGKDMYEVCPGCVRAKERRTCDGLTEVTFDFCPEHAESAAKDKYLDTTMLNEIRRLIHPLYSTVPTYPITAAGITATSKRDLETKVKMVFANVPRGHVRRSVLDASYAYGAIIDAQSGHARGFWQAWEEDPSRHRPIRAMYKHAKGCIHSDEPDVVLKSEDAVEAMDEFARERLGNINALLEAGVDYELTPGPHFGVQPVKGGEIGEKSMSTNASLTSKFSETGADSDADLTPEAAAHLVLQNSKSEARMLLYAEKTRLEGCLATSSLAKGIYFKRCNGQWISALDDILPYGQGRDLAAHVKHGVTRETIENDVIEQMRQNGLYVEKRFEDGKEKAFVVAIHPHGHWWPESFHMPDGTGVIDLDDASRSRAIALLAKKNDSEGSNKTSVMIDTSSLAQKALGYICKSTSNFEVAMAILWDYRAAEPDYQATKLNRASGEGFLSVVTTMAALGALFDISIPVAKSVNTILPVDPSVTSYGYAVLPSSDAPILPSLLLAADRFYPNAPNELSLERGIDAGHLETLTPIEYNRQDSPSTFKYLASMLASREAMLRSGQRSQEDLIVTSWGYNRLVKKQIVKRMEGELKAREAKGKKRKADGELGEDIIVGRGDAHADGVLHS